MTPINEISDAELLFDRQESFNDVISCLVALQEGVGDMKDVQDRMATNLKIINKITAECKRRGFDPAQFQG